MSKIKLSISNRELPRRNCFRVMDLHWRAIQRTPRFQIYTKLVLPLGFLMEDFLRMVL
nr:hypothetical protein Iba_chr03aCG9660 [Ipomoea batatas]GMC74324.1 hypothetical protein Iba_chr03cCG9160 [Ipomoea batatas]